MADGLNAASTHWDDRYSGAAFFYGTAPNDFLAEHHRLLAGPVLSLSEGEGRNAVFLAQRGLDVLGVDLSEVGLRKAEQLAAERGVHIRTLCADLATYTPQAEQFGAVISIFAHLPSSLRQRLYPLVVRSLKPGGIFLLEAYSLDQLPRSTGGPKDADMLMSVDKIRAEWPTLEPLLLRETEREVREGQGHTGLAAVVQFIGRKPA
ncbi:SAM-dependent methyltransferase [Lampropedia cohaerens]|uniref:SAM-dependent methyltransferase n=1 Tax=Lampropedia cohaerens TaxID=1610491 RepID=A0A0U1Q3N3_9BURK|nr:class I SAM-dependent methyltransferase [Lampropedia cohaerens]KKW69347.1 SAM-dependent methyltransferase [Lampropedia cohaerens]